MPVRFVRKKNRTMMDVFNSIIQPKAKMQLQSLVQKIATYNKRNHTWKNRTGALEDTINWTPPEKDRRGWFASVFAGGWAKVKYTFDVTKRREGRRKRPYRYQRGQRISLKRRMGLFVNYARYVEDKGYPVLIQGLRHFRVRGKRMIQNGLKVGALR